MHHKNLKISIIIPAYNEEQTITDVIEQILHYCEPLNYEIIVVNDKSEDNTADRVKQFDEVILIEHIKNMGKGAALQTGFKSATGDIFLIQDADMEYHPKDIPNLIVPFVNGEADVVYGSRFRGEGIHSMSRSHRLGNKGLSLVTRLLYGFKTTDMETGYKAFRKELIDDVKLSAKSFNIEPELTAHFSKRKAKFVEIPISYKYREKGNAKISWKDGVVALWWLIKLRFK